MLAHGTTAVMPPAPSPIMPVMLGGTHPNDMPCPPLSPPTGLTAGYCCCAAMAAADSMS
jgi:hypothetical protein